VFLIQPVVRLWCYLLRFDAGMMVQRKQMECISASNQEGKETIRKGKKKKIREIRGKKDARETERCNYIPGMTVQRKQME
jgi:hypothetical protein